MNNYKTKEEIFDQQALLGMIEYHPKGFRKRFNTLFMVIMNSMEVYKNQEFRKMSKVSK